MRAEIVVFVEPSCGEMPERGRLLPVALSQHGLRHGFAKNFEHQGALIRED